MTYRHFSVAFYAITVTLRVSHGLRRVTHVPGAVPLLAFLAREPGLPRQPVGVVAGRAAPRARDRVRPPRTRPPFGAADAGRETLERWHRLQRDLRGAKDKLSGTIAIFASVTACQSFLPELLGAFRSRHPGSEERRGGKERRSCS